jgi:hypothetical protein
MKTAIPILLLGALAAAAELPRDEAAAGWVTLAEPDWGKLAFADFTLRFEMKAASPGASGSLFVRAAADGNPKETGYEIQLGPGNPLWPSGSVVEHTRAVAGAQPLGQWLPFEVEAAGGKLTVRVFDRAAATANGLLGQAGVLRFVRGPGIEVRNVRINPTGAQELFNGADLSGWKSTGTQPKQGGIFSKVLGKNKPTEAKWTVTGGVIRGENGPGQLESAAPHGDFLLQTAVQIPKRRIALLIRGDAGKVGTGYEISLGPSATGGIAGLAPPRAALGIPGEFAMITVAAQNRRLEVWVDGTIVAVADDVRPEGPDPRKDARTTPGVIAFYTPEGGQAVAIRNVRITDLPKALGHTNPKAASPATAASVPPPAAPGAPPAPPPVQFPAAPPAAGSNPQVDAIQQQMQAQQRAKAEQDQKEQKISSLLQQALKSKSPEEQVALYDQILALDPNQQVAYNARKDAQARIDARADAAAHQQDIDRRNQEDQANRQQTFAAAVKRAEESFVKGDLQTTASALRDAEKISPNDPVVRALHQRLDAATARKTSWLAIGGASTLGVLLCGTAVLVLRHGQKAPYLEIVAGLDKGKKFNIDQEVLQLGGIPGDGGEKNDIVLRDAERMVSRFHARIINHRGRLYVLDVGSANGTFVDKKRVSSRTPYRLRNGSRVSFGGTCVVRIGYEKRSQSKKG